MAFQEVKPKTFALPVWQRKFVGFDNFVKAFTDRIFGQTMINTIGISLIGLFLGTVIGMFQSVVGVILLFIANKVAGLLGESRLV